MGHKITSLSIVNFKSIISEDFEFSDYTPLVGYNNAGKTNIVETIIWILRKSSLKTTDFNNPLSPIVITAKIEGINEELLNRLNETHRDRIVPFIDSECLIIRRIQPSPNIAINQIRLEVLNLNADDEADPWQPNPAGIDNAIKDLFPEPIHIGAMEDSEEDIRTGGYIIGFTD